MVQAVFQGNYEEVESLLTKSLAGNVSDADKRTPLHAAAYRGFAEIAGTAYVTDKVKDFVEVSCFALNCIIMPIPKPCLFPKKLDKARVKLLF